MRANIDIKRHVEWDDTIPPQTSLLPDRHRFWRRRVMSDARATARCLGVALGVAAVVLIAAGPWPAIAQAVQLVEVDVKTVAQGYRTSKLKGTNVVNDKNEKIGDIDDIIIGADKKLLFAIIEVGGFLG